MLTTPDRLEGVAVSVSMLMSYTIAVFLRCKLAGRPLEGIDDQSRPLDVRVVDHGLAVNNHEVATTVARDLENFLEQPVCPPHAPVRTSPETLVSVSHERIGNVLVEQGNLPAALDSYQASLAIRDRLAKADPGNAGWQRDLALSQGHVGMVEARQGARDRALKSLREGRDIIARLKAQAPDNATLPKVLAWFDRGIAAGEIAAFPPRRDAVSMR